MNLLPETEKYVVDQELKSRKVASQFYILSFVLVVLSVLSLSIYFIEGAKYFEVKSKITQEVVPGNVDFTDLLALPEALNSKVTILNALNYSTSTLSYISAIIENKPSAVQVMGIAYKKDSIIITGLSDTREALSIFINNLKESHVFEDASVPVSDFTKERNLEFTLTAILAHK